MSRLCLFVLLMNVLLATAVIRELASQETNKAEIAHEVVREQDSSADYTGLCALLTVCPGQTNWDCSSTDPNYVGYCTIFPSTAVWAGVGCVSPIGSVKSLAMAFTNPCDGVIPTSLGGMTDLTGLMIMNEGLTGTIPTQIASLTKVATLSLTMTDISGTIPSVLGKMSSLNSLSLYSNSKLSGAIPSELCGLTNLATIDVSDTKVCGVIPPCLLESGTVSISPDPLPLCPNTGDYPGLCAFLAICPGLSGEGLYWDCSSTDPNYDGYCTSTPKWNLVGCAKSNRPPVTSLVLAGAAGVTCTGGIPSALGGMTDLVTIGIVNTKLTGPIPTEISQLTKVTYLGITDKLSGTIPTELGKMSSLKRLRLSGDQLSGSIPTQLCGIASLTVIDVSNTKICGDKPTCLSESVTVTGLVSCPPTSNPTTTPSTTPTTNPSTTPISAPIASQPSTTSVKGGKKGNQGSNANTKVPKIGGKKTITKSPIFDQADKGEKAGRKRAVVPNHTKVPKAPRAGRGKGAKQGKEMEE